MRDAVCGWHTESNGMRKWSQLSTVTFTSLRKNNSTIIKMQDAAGLHEHCSHVDGYKTALSSFLLPTTLTAHSASFYLH